MPQPSRPLRDIFVTGRPDRLEHHLLTPRTPHSRSGRAEEGHTETEREQLRNGFFDDDDPFLSVTPTRHQSESLLSRSERSSLPTGYRSRGDDHEIRGPGSVQLLAHVRKFFYISASFMGCAMLALFMMAFRRPSVPVDSTQSTQHSVSVLHGDIDASFAASGRVISYENYTNFPLTGAQYRQECDKVVEFLDHKGYWDPPRKGTLDVPHPDGIVDKGSSTTCTNSITYLLDGHVGLATDLALLAQVAGLARERNVPFFVDDTHWNRGKWTDHFERIRALQEGTESSCQAPPPQELVACPRSARHWVISSETASFHLGDEFATTFEDSSVLGVYRKKPLYDRALRTLTDTIRPNTHTLALIRAARYEIASILSLPNETHSSQHHDRYIGVHIRTRSQGAKSSVSNESYIPLEKYAQSARDTWTRFWPGSPLPQAPSSIGPSEPAHFPAPPITYVASDSPEGLRDFIAAFPSSTAIFALDLSTNPDLRALAPQHTYVQDEWMHESEEERVALTRGILVDLALLSGLWHDDRDIVPGAVICSSSSNICGLGAVGLGWDRAFGFEHDVDSGGKMNEARRWIEIENPRTEVSSWNAFHIPR